MSNGRFEKLLSALRAVKDNDNAILLLTFIMQELNYFGVIFSDDVHSLYRNASLADVSRKLEGIFDMADTSIISKIKNQNMRIITELEQEAEDNG